ncbi:uncharacterized protein [Prorops nasuta]|uniref:uncharacterized protein isoform X2 n=1 Tax=Prorops nasuta TaxID=863751 RepID=UPI0034CE940E
MSFNNPHIRLLSGYDMPLVGFGTFRIQGQQTILDVVNECLKSGYRSIDTAAVYKNEADIGFALKTLLPKYNLKREDIFITTKLSPHLNGNEEGIFNAVNQSIKALNSSYLDLYLIHWPGAAGISESSNKNKNLRINTWKSLIKLQQQGLIRSLGVSNYTTKHLLELLEAFGDVIPSVNQVECHPHYRQEYLRSFCQKKGIHIQAYSSLGTSSSNSLLKDPTIIEISSELNVSPARILLKWGLQQGIIPKAVKKEHIRDNIKLDFLIQESQMHALSNLPQQKYAWDPINVF